MQLVEGSVRIFAEGGADPSSGKVRWAPAKSVWMGGMTVAALAAPFWFSWSGLALLLTGCGVTLCFGHSVGIHRRLIHSSFTCPRWLERICVYLGTVVGMAGPVGMIRLHDLRDWAQRQQVCHDYFCHRGALLYDAW